MKGLASLIRLHKLKLTEQQKKLNDLQAVAQGFLNEIDALDKSARAEAAAADDNAETAYTLGNYVQASRARRATLQASLNEIEREMGIIRDLVATAFRELKRYELIAERRAADQARSDRKIERNTEDELGMSMFRLKRQNDET
jgi:flagellar export protein FliJ